jgi:hypothetical protein
VRKIGAPHKILCADDVAVDDRSTVTHKRASHMVVKNLARLAT